jgi:hypothetical protein
LQSDRAALLGAPVIGANFVRPAIGPFPLVGIAAAQNQLLISELGHKGSYAKKYSRTLRSADR